MSEGDVVETERTALLYDVHGNAAALEAVLEDVASRGIGTLVFGGDYANAGPRPAECVRRIRRAARAAIRGNTDEWVTGQSEPPDPEPFEWTRRHLSAEQLDWLEARPFDLRLHPPPGTEETDDLLVVHANPSDVLTPLILQPHPYDEWAETPADRAEELVEGVSADLVTFGHIHNPSSGEVAGQRLRSIGSVGLPWDEDRRAAYGIAEWEDGAWFVEDVRVEYDSDAVVDELERSDQPGAGGVAESLRTASFGPMA
ncbi:MAG: metallophosphoesterase [Bradymonadaceae bacterium]